MLAELANKLSNRLMHSPTKTIRQLLQQEASEPQALINSLLDI